MVRGEPPRLQRVPRPVEQGLRERGETQLLFDQEMVQLRQTGDVPLHHRRQQMGARSGHQGSRHRVQEHVPAYGQAPAIPQEGRPRLVPHRRLGDSRKREKPETAERPMPEAYGKVQI